MNPTTTPMNLHPYLTPDLLTLIRTASPEEIDKRLRYVAMDDTDAEKNRLGFRVEARKSGGRRFGLNLPVNYEGFAFSGGYNALRRRVNLKADWRELFITRFNEVLHDCESRLAESQARQDANAQFGRMAKARNSAVVPVLEPIPSSCRWGCEKRYKGVGIKEDLQIDTAAFTPEQIAQIINLVRSFAP